VNLPLEESPGIRGPLERLNGRHLWWEYDDEIEPTLSLGPVIPRRTLVSLIERRVDREGGRSNGVMLDALGSVLLVRGSDAAPTDAVRGATETAKATVGEFGAIADSLKFRTHVRLLSGDASAPLGPGPPGSVAVIDSVRVLSTGERAAFGTRSVRPIVADFDVEVASSMAVADPINAMVETGETVHLWTSTTIAKDGTRVLCVQGLLDVAVESSPRTFDPDVYELGVLEQPTIQTFQVLFASTVEPGKPLVVTLSGLPTPSPQRRLEITAEALMPTISGDGVDASPDPLRVIDLSRGMWRDFVHQPHAMTGEELRVRLPEARMPASAAQLITLVFGRGTGDRPDLGSSIVLLPGKGDLDRPRVQALFESLDPVGPGAVLTVSAEDSGFSATLPVTLGALLRVSRTEETIYLVDYAPQIANDATLSDPRAEFFVTGDVLECAVHDSAEGLTLEGSVERRVIRSVAVRESDPMEVGRIQQPTTMTSAAKLRATSSQPARAGGLTVTLRPR
jgi:hypothetical protein